MTSRAWRLTAAAALAAGSMAIAACGDDNDSESAGGGGGGDKADLANCKFTFGVMAPITGDAASIGQEQLNWAKYAVTTFNKENGTKFALEEGDTQLDPGQASTVAQQLVSNNAVRAVVGPAGSQEVEAVGPVLDRAKLAYVSPSATKTDLAGGKYKGFSRVVSRPTRCRGRPTPTPGGDPRRQERRDHDDQTSYSDGPGRRGREGPKEKGRQRLPHLGPPQAETDFSAVISRGGAMTSTTCSCRGRSRRTRSQIRQPAQGAEQGRRDLGSDGVYSPGRLLDRGVVHLRSRRTSTSVDGSSDVVEGDRSEYGSFGTLRPAGLRRVAGRDDGRKTCARRQSDPRARVSKEVRKGQDPGLHPRSHRVRGATGKAKFFIFTVSGASSPPRRVSQHLPSSRLGGARAGDAQCCPVRGSVRQQLVNRR
jgi:branched-chain amino acid transport system substrate-binding protein